LLQGLLERREAGLPVLTIRGPVQEHANPAHPLGLLRARHERPCSHRADNEHNELTPFQLSELHALCPYWSAVPSSAIRGTRIVKVELQPTLLSTMRSPPIIWQKRRLITRPSPVPPYLLAVEEDAWENSWNSFPHLLRRHTNGSVANRDADPIATIL
jgi:hypothetical protein